MNLNSMMGALGALSGGSSEGANPLMSALLSMLAGGGASSGNIGGIGGIADLVQKFQANGMGDLVQSWIGSGQNLPVSADQLSQVFGSDAIGELASSTGMNSADVSGQLSNMLPQMIDQLTPGGEAPSGGFGDIGSLLQTLGAGGGAGGLAGMLGGMLGGNR